jgi:dienelactone hydrolase
MSPAPAIPLSIQRLIPLFAWLLLVASTGATSAAKIENVTFATNFIAKSHESKVQVQAKLYLPDAPKFPLAAMIISPSSGGVLEAREIYYASELANAGIAALVIDSFASRGLTKSSHDQTLLGPWQSGNDAVAGLRWLIADGRIKPDRIGVMGVSKGGVVAMRTAFDLWRRAMRYSDVAFAAHVPISPDCGQVFRSVRTNGAPMFLMLAEKDDSVSTPWCVEYAQTLRAAGHTNIEVKVYKGAQHAWEAIGPKPLFDAKAQNHSRCRALIEDDGSFTAPDGTKFAAGGWNAWAQQTCRTLGTYCCGGTADLKRQATADMIAFLRKNGF